MVLIVTKSLTAHHCRNVGIPSSILFPGCSGLLDAMVPMNGLFLQHLVFLSGQSTTLQTLPSHLTSWNNAGALHVSWSLVLLPLPLLLLHQNSQMYVLGSAYAIPCMLCPLDVRRSGCTFLIWKWWCFTQPIILSNTAHSRHSSWIVSVTSTACSRVLKVHAGNLSRGVGPAWCDPLFQQHQLCATSRSS